MPMTPQQYVGLARTAILAVLDDQHAAVGMELEARIADRPHPSVGLPINPHHISTAYQGLLRSGQIAVRNAQTRGNRSLELAYLTGRRNSTKVSEATGRKGLLLSRYLGWAQGTPTRPGIIGPAAEAVVHRSLREAAADGYRLAQPQGGNVTTFLGHTVPIGALDSAAIFTPLDTAGLPARAIALPVEVKNLRDWMYPHNDEPYQLLTKAHLLAASVPEQPMVPVLICRQAHPTIYRMASDLGFFVIDARRQYIGPTAEEAKLAEIRAELGFLDLAHEPGADERLVRRFTHTLPGYAAIAAARWKVTASIDRFGNLFNAMRTSGFSAERTRILVEIRDTAQDAGLLTRGGW